jgi:hypothetical protein
MAESNVQEFFAAGGEGRKVDASVAAYVMNTLVGQGHLLQMNRIGAITAVTADLKPGEFQTVIWDWRAQQDPDVGLSVAEFRTVERAEGFAFRPDSSAIPRRVRQQSAQRSRQVPRRGDNPPGLKARRRTPISASMPF